jgi:Lamin Tail Domain/Chitobiase/beta-hexosaminidase C-terminal domain/CotH kinase protein/Fn3 associated
LVILLAASGPLRALEPRINEFVADNKNGLSDADHDEVDWVEIYNPNPVALDLTGWYLTDDLATPANWWQFPATSINPNGYLVVFASGKDRRPAGGELHTNFSLKASGEEIALIKPDGVTVVSHFVFGQQFTDVSYGPASVTSSTETLIAANASARAFVPANSTLGTTWTTTAFNDSAWASGPLAVGYETMTGYESLIGLDVRTAMNGVRTSCYIRIPFTVTNLADVLGLTLRMRYDDGFAVYLNGTLLPTAGRNAPSTLAFDSAASADHPDSEAILYEDINITQHLGLLTPGTNVLAIHGLNVGLSSSDFLIGPQLVLTRGTFSNGFMTTPTPGAPNSSGVQGFVSDTHFSVDRGFFTAPFDVVITCDTPGAVIRYTRNGDAPTATTGFVYSGPINITGTTNLRAAAFKDGFQPSNIDTHSYFFLDDVITQSANGAPPSGWPVGPVNGQKFDYGMDPNVVNSRIPTIKSALQSIPTMSIVTDLSNLVDPATGIYVHAGDHGVNWERPISMEILNDPLNPSPKGFQQNGGIRIRGGFSRSSDDPKHSLRFFFRSEYGAGKMKYKLFGDAGASEFNGFDMRTSQDASWAYLGSSENTFLRDEVSRDTQVLISAGSRCRYFHLYLNGQYWGLYNTDERPNGNYGEQYFGGNDDEYDVLKSAGASGGYATEATDGTMDPGSAWQLLWSGARTVRTSPTNANYFKLLGRAADGVTPTNDPVVLDPVNLADYLLILFYMGGDDGPVSDYVGASNNWFGMRRRGGTIGFRFFIHDFEQSLGLEGGTNQRVGKGATIAPWSNTVAGANDINRSNPEFIHEDLAPNLEYRVLFGDRAHKHLFNNGNLIDTKVLARMNAFAAIIDTAIWGESARWGDAQREPPFIRTDWLEANNRLFDFIRFGSTNGSGPGRTATLVAQLRGYDSGTKPLYPLTNAPVFSQHGGAIPAGGTSITMSQSNTGTTTLYYTVNGSDPRMVGGAVHPSALTYSGAVALNGWTSTVRARVKKGTEWSALNEAVFVRNSGPPPIRIVEIMFAPAGPSTAEIAAGFTDKDEFEYFELQNVGTESVNLRDIRFSQGLDVTFADAILVPGERGVVVRNRAAFQMRYGTGPRVLGEYVGALNDGGERIAFVSALGATIGDFSYEDNAPWPAGLTGRSLVLRNPALDPDNPASWRPSVSALGNPGATDTTTYAAWKMANGVGSDSADLDKDGLLPIEEYAMGGSPVADDAARNPTASRAPFIGPPAGDYLLMSYRWKRGADDLAAVVEQSTDLATWTASPAEQVSSEPMSDGTDLLTFKTLPISGAPPRVFLRVRWTNTP